MKVKEIVLFDNYNVTSSYERAREFLFEKLHEDEFQPCYEVNCIDDIKDSDIWEEVSFTEEALWDDIKDYLESLCEDTLIVTGIVGRWNGRAEGGTVVQSYFELQDLWKDCEYIKIWDEGGHLYIECSHHDGTNYYEVKKLTERGYERYNNWEYGYGKDCSDREIHEKLMHCSTYSRLPRLAKAMGLV